MMQKVPCSIETENAVLGCVLLDPASLDALLAESITPRHFYDLSNERIFGAMVDLHREGKAINEVTLVTRLNAEAGVISKLAELVDAAPAAAALHHFLPDLKAYELRRAILTTCGDIERATRSDKPNPELFAVQVAMLAEAQAQLNGADARRDQIRARRYDANNRPPEMKPVFWLGDKVISTVGNITTISAQAKAGKSALVDAAIASTMAVTGSDTLGFRSLNPNALAVVHVDTEQSPEDHWQLVSRSIRRAGRTIAPEWLHSYSFAGFDARTAMRAMEQVVADASKQHGGLHSIHIDGAADLINDVNDAEESNAFVSRLHDMAIQNNCALLTVIHVNPNGEKTRGHLGSQLERKSETNLRLDKTDEVTEVWSDKQRRAPILKGTGPRFRWCDNEGMHVSVETASRARSNQQLEKLKFERDEVFGERMSMRYGEIISTAISALRVSERTAGRRFDEWRKFGLIEKHAANLWAKKDLQ